MKNEEFRMKNLGAKLCFAFFDYKNVAREKEYTERQGV
jgi:hypothetical protein